MTHSATPILNLETPVPLPGKSLTFVGLLKALPVAIGLIALVPAMMYLRFVLGVHISPWWSANAAPFLRVMENLANYGVFVTVSVPLVIMFLVTLFHEMGHATAALALGWPILEFRVFPLSIKKQGGKREINVSWKSWPGAMVVAEPTPFARYHTKQMLFALAGPASNLITGAVVILLCSGSGSSLPSAIARLFIMFSLGMGIFNVLPVHLSGLELDGYCAFVVSRRRQLLAARIASLRLSKHVLSNKPLNSMNRRWLALAESPGSVSLQNRGGLWLAYCYWLQHKQFDRAAGLLEKMLQACNNDDVNFRALVFAECAVFASLRKNGPAALAWKSRTVDLFLAEHLRHRMNTYVAWGRGDQCEALREAILAQDAVQKLDHKTQEGFLPSWNRWIAALEKSSAERTPNPDQERTPNDLSYNHST